MTKSNSEKKGAQFNNPFTENFIPSWDDWKAFKKEQFKFTYKPMGEQSAISYLFQLSGGNEEIAKLIIQRSKAQGWKGFFELPINFNGKITQRITEKPTATGNVAPGGFGQF